jgi:protein-S-isoprenylcysteine O-methyltransferase Ste14
MTASQVSTTRSAIAWAGGVAFVVSLLWCFLAILFGMPESGVPDAPAFTFAVINFVLFTLFAAHHSLFARTGIKRWITSQVPPELERSTYVWISSLLLILVCIAWRPLPGVAYAHYGAVAIVHWVIVVAGFWLTFRSASVLDPLVLAGIRQATGQEFTSEFKLVGPYFLVRHPIYLGWLLIVFGAPVMTWTRLEFAVVSSAYLVFAIPFEERTLVDAFGDTYRDYQRQVRWRLVPWVW